MITTDLQKYIIKRQFIKNIKLLDHKSFTIEIEVARQHEKSHHFKSNNNVEFTLKIIPLTVDDASKFPDMDAIKIYPELLKEFNKHLESKLTLLAQYVMQDVPTEDIMKGIIPKFKDIKLTPEFLQWNLPAIHEIVAAYLNDTAIFWSEKPFNVMLMFENNELDSFFN